MLKQLLVICSILSIVLFAEDVFAQRDTRPQTPVGYFEKSWVSDLAVGFKVGAGYQQRSVNNGEYPMGYVLGPELTLDIFKISNHKIVFNFGYLYLDNKVLKGPSMLKVKTSYQRLDATFGYDFVWKILLAGARVGTAMTIIKIKTTYGEPNWKTVEYEDGSTEIIYDSPNEPDISKKTGVNMGFLAGIGLGLALGEFLFKKKDLLEIRAQSDYVRRGTRNEFTIYGLLAIYPTKLFRP